MLTFQDYRFVANRQFDALFPSIRVRFFSAAGKTILESTCLTYKFTVERKITFWENKKRRFWNVPLSVDVTNELRRYINTLPKGQRKLFTFTGRTAYNKLQHYLKKAGITKPLAFHDLRRTYMKTAKKRGIPSKVVSQVTGDKVSTIEEFYENFTHEELLEEIDKK